MTFGCQHCWPTSPDAARRALDALVWEADLIDESHFIVTIGACPACSQRFVSVFTETIDWTDGEDPQSRIVMPITESEEAALMARSPVTETDLNTLGPGRQSLRHDWPKGMPPRSFWTTGIWVGPHD
jgi:hypothetical protein